jgi:serine/threonine protein kinase
MSEIDLARKAVDEGLVRFLVIKRIKADKNDDPSFVRMFKDEARISSELHHGNIAQVYDFGKEGDEYYLVLEYVPGIDVRRIVNEVRERDDHMPLRVTLRIMCDVLEGLYYAHTRVDALGKPMHIVHRDVNPRNIMVSSRGETKLIDFGVAKATGRLERTRTDHVKGKFAYMAPEQVGGASDIVDHRADVFAAALTLHEMIAGFGPFYGLNQVQIMHRLLNGTLPDLPPHKDLADTNVLRKVQKKALATKADDRYPDCDAYRKDLERVADRIGGLATRQEVAAFVAKVEPTLEEHLRAKINKYSGPLEFSKAAAPATTVPSPPDITGAADESSLSDEIPGLSVSASVPGTFSNTTGSASVSVARAGVAIGGVAAVAGLSVLVLVLLAVVVGLAIQNGTLGDDGNAHAGNPPTPPPMQPGEPPLPAAIPPEPAAPPPVAPAVVAPPPSTPPPTPPATHTPRETHPAPATDLFQTDRAPPGPAADEPPTEVPVAVEVAPTPPVEPPPPAAVTCAAADRTATILVQAPDGAKVKVGGKSFVIKGTNVKVPWCPGEVPVAVDGFGDLVVHASGASTVVVKCEAGACSSPR